jgi:Cu2+-exporting ATPase
MGRGTDAAGSAADVILLGDKLTQLREAIFIGDATMAKIKQNLTLALMYNSLGIPIAAGALLPKFDIVLSPTLAAAMMACSSIVVVGNSVLLKKKFADQ